MARQLLAVDKLLELMNRQLVHYDTCTECRFKSIVPLEGFDESGCNWSHANLNCRSYPAAVGQPVALCRPATVCQPFAASVMSEAKEKYNIR